MKTEDRGQRTADYRLQTPGRTLKACGLGLAPFRNFKFLKFLTMLVFLTGLAAWSAGPVFAGNIDSPAAPSDDSGRMYTLEQIYDKVNDGTTPTKQSGGFNEPAAGPASTMHTLDDIEGKIASGTTDATAGDVLDGKYVITRTAGNGESRVTGSMADREGDNASTAQAAAGGVNYLTSPAGYYDGDDRVSATDAEVAALAPDLTAANVVTGATIFGVAGSGGGGNAGLPKTGQTTNYRTGDDETYADPAGGFDIGLPQGKGTWASYWSARFTDNGDGTVTDNATGLMWARDGSGAGCNYGALLTWATAIDWAEALIFADYDDWRLPNAYELFSITLLEARSITSVKNAGAPYINQTVFPNTESSSFYWSSTTYPNNADDALYVYFGVGIVGGFPKTYNLYVRAVRGGQ